jgi:predicted AAA+ superfamily ATPase
MGEKTNIDDTVNPFKYLGPLDPEKDEMVCAKRENDAELVVNGILRGDYWAIIGPRQIGKTTFLRLLEKKLKDDSNNPYILYFDFQVPPSTDKTLYQTMVDQ